MNYYSNKGVTFMIPTELVWVIAKKNRTNLLVQVVRFCSPYGIRTRITTVKGWCPNP